MENSSDSKLENLIPEREHSKPPYIMACDIGTSSLRCIIYDEMASKLCTTHEKIKLLCPQPGYVEIDPTQLWERFIHAVRKAFECTNLKATDIKCLGLSTQRASFLLWDKVTGEPLHNFITWKDVRADALIKEWNSSFLMKTVRFGTGFLYHVMRKKRYLAASIIKFDNVQVNMRLKWILENNAKVKRVLAKGALMFGTLDTWLIYKLTDGKIYATDPSNASGTAIYDPYLNEWSGFLIKLLNLPRNIFPEIRNSIGNWGETSPQYFGSPIPITAVVSDQGAAMFGGCGFKQGCVKMTLGTGAFINLNTGRKPHTSINGIYPVIGWKDSVEIVYMAEGSSNDNGIVIQWGKDIKLYEEHYCTSAMAESVSSSGGVYFIPSFQGLQAPINDAQASSGFIGLTIETRPEHLVRAMLESLAFRVYQIYRTLRTETDYNFLTIRIDGGVSQNDFLMQMIATLVDKDLERMADIETSSLGACFLAGLGAGVWNDKTEVEKLPRVEKVFHPQPERRSELFAQMRSWERALKRFTEWYPKEDTKSKSPSWTKCLETVTTEWEATEQLSQLSSSSNSNETLRPPVARYKFPLYEYLTFYINFFIEITTNIPFLYMLALLLALVSYFYFSPGSF